MTPVLRDAAKRLAHASGTLAAAHRRRNRANLTVVTFHRVLPADDPRAATADPRYTVTPELFAACLRFFARHYTPVAAADAIAARAGGPPLPPRPLLVTIDDGWADTVEHALPVLRRTGTPAVVFAVSGTIGQRFGFWPERVIGAWRAGRIDPGSFGRARALAGLGEPEPCPVGEAAVRELIGAMMAGDRRRRQTVLSALPLDTREPDPPEMASARQLRALRSAGIEVGAHGVTHEPFLTAADPGAEVHAPREELRAVLGEPVRTLSFPHGSYDARRLDEAREAGYELVFTSETVLTPLVAGAPPSDALGRVGIPGPDVTDARGRLRPDLLALWLFRRPVRALAGDRRATAGEAALAAAG